MYTSGPQGVEGRLPGAFPKQLSDDCNLVVITDPFVLYQNYVLLGRLEKDEAQIRTMKEFQKLYYRVVDYKPPQDMAIRTSLLLRKLEIRLAEELLKMLSLQGKPLYRLRQWFTRDVDSEKRDIVKFMTDEEELHNIAAPQGLLVNGEVGCGKSMLMDIFANALPHQSKMRWHYNNFILWVFGEIHSIQKEHMLTASVHGKHKLTMENEFILFEIAQKMISRSTVFMLDEFMLPDVASAQIVRILFTFYFKLGGVLVATSNKLPEELYSSGFNKSRFKSFVGILNSRCVAVNMKSEVDYRLHFALTSSRVRNMVIKENNKDHETEWNRIIKLLALGIDASSPLMNPDVSIEDLDSRPATFTVYNRTTELPVTFNNTTCYCTFDHVCQGLFSSSDYITLASKYKTVIIDHVPVMTTKMKNEAQRFITLLDALYEARCQFFMRSQVDVDELFFPIEAKNEGNNNQRVQEEEMYAKTAIDTLNPYRPNVTSYDKSYAKEYNDSGELMNFGNVGAFTGEDEKFAYKRAVLRIREMVGSDYWRSSDRWIPIDGTMRPWETRENAIGEIPMTVEDIAFSPEDEIALLAKSLRLSLQGSLPRDICVQLNIPFREFNRKVAPAFVSLQHFWAMGEWTLVQQKKIKDKIARTWVSGGIRNKP